MTLESLFLASTLQPAVLNLTPLEFVCCHRFAAVLEAFLNFACLHVEENSIQNNSQRDGTVRPPPEHPNHNAEVYPIEAFKGRSAPQTEEPHAGQKPLKTDSSNSRQRAAAVCAGCRPPISYCPMLARGSHTVSSSPRSPDLRWQAHRHPWLQ